MQWLKAERQHTLVAVNRPFRQRIFGWLVVVSVVPAAVAIVVALVSRGMEAPVGGAAAWERAGESWQVARSRLDTTTADSATLAAIASHEQELSTSWRRAMQAQDLRTRFRAIVATITISLIVLVGGGAVLLAGHLSRQMSRPIDELVDWTRLLQHGESLPMEPPAKGAPEFDLLRRAFRAAEIELQRSRRRDVQAAELRAFRDMARQVAHELKNPLTPIRFAIARLATDMPPEKKELMDVLTTESARLERLARDFGDLGRLPEGPTAPVDLSELLQGVLKSAVPDTSRVQLRQADATPLVPGHYEVLRRAFLNLVLNAVDAMNGAQAHGRTGAPASLTVRIEPAELQGKPAVSVSIRDSGPGIPPENIGKVFEPYFTTKTGGTGLGLAIVRQTIHHHGGTIAAANAPEGGAVFTVVLPAAAA